MKLVVIAALAAGCLHPFSHPLMATSKAFLSPQDSITTVAHPWVEAQQLVIDKLGTRGFTLVERSVTPTRATLRFVGNRDYTDFTIGSVFYAWIDPISPGVTRVTLTGKPTVRHEESCPSFDGTKCDPVRIGIGQSDWGLSGREEADVIRGVFAELALDAELTRGS